MLSHGSRRRSRCVGLQQLGEFRRRRRLGGGRRSVGAFPLRRHDAAFAPAVADDRSVRNRLRYMDSRVGEDGANAIYALGDLATIQMTPPGHRSYIIFDANYEDYLAGFAQEHCRKLITPDLEQIEKLPRRIIATGTTASGRHTDADVLHVADTLEELEADLGFAPGVLVGCRGEMERSMRARERTTTSIPCRKSGSMRKRAAVLRMSHRREPLRNESGPRHQRGYAGYGRQRPSYQRTIRRLAHGRGRVRREQLRRRPHSRFAHGRCGLGICGGYLCGTSAVEHEIDCD